MELHQLLLQTLLLCFQLAIEALKLPRRLEDVHVRIPLLQIQGIFLCVLSTREATSSFRGHQEETQHLG